MSIRPGWFYHAAEDARVKSVAELVDIYYKSVGRNAVLLLNVPADKRGLIHDADAERLCEFRHVINETFATNLAHKVVSASSEADHTGRFDPSNVLDGYIDSCWMAGEDDKVPELVFTLDEQQEFDRILLAEQIAFGQRVRCFVVEVERDGKWHEIAEGTHDRLQAVAADSADQRNAAAAADYGITDGPDHCRVWAVQGRGERIARRQYLVTAADQDSHANPLSGIH